ncbi:hypothetical protein PILCRDRAFT_827874 [Piloderma croceum F 1598]|uniref:Ubiquitin carboxyl-terminal hydrolase n=1 Tax=Piloderma croceum (strain F 1598) TaxID=765440 RepID=A0A0C3F4J2_PILCF|nr:hypothetical protein PILCRDRAFT_827874 [Piloderma croceum F 1598]
MSDWIPLECNPEVFNKWANKAGLVSSSAQFYDIYGLDPELLSMVPRPVKAVVLVFPYGEARDRRRAEDERIAKEGGPNVDETVFWAKQTVPGACGTMALIHGLANSDVTLAPESPLRKFIDECKDKSSFDRGKHLGNSPLLRDIHASLAREGQSAPPLRDNVDQAYTCFVVAPSPPGAVSEAASNSDADATNSTPQRIVELDGTRAGPVDRGVCTDLVDDVARIVKEDFIKNSNSVKFSLMYLGQPM